MNAKKLFRSILREHRKLPADMRILGYFDLLLMDIGDSYVRNEFKLHMKAKPEHLTQFFDAWGTYLSTLQEQDKYGLDMDIGKDISLDAAKKLDRDQQSKLKELKVELETRKVFNED